MLAEIKPLAFLPEPREQLVAYRNRVAPHPERHFNHIHGGRIKSGRGMSKICQPGAAAADARRGNSGAPRVPPPFVGADAKFSCSLAKRLSNRSNELRDYANES